MTDDRTPYRQQNRQRGALALLAVIALAVTGATPAWFAPNNSQTIAYKLVVHGALLPVSRVFSHSSSPLGCLWGSTYNMRSGTPDAQPGDSVPYITFSFFMERNFVDLVSRGVIDSVAPDPKFATHHTRLYLTTGDGPPAARHQRRNDPLGDAYLLHPFGEYYLANHGIPTKLDSRGAPAVRAYTPEERAAVLVSPDPRVNFSACPTGG